MLPYALYKVMSMAKGAFSCLGIHVLYDMIYDFELLSRRWCRYTGCAMRKVTILISVFILPRVEKPIADYGDTFQCWVPHCVDYVVATSSALFFLLINN